MKPPFINGRIAVCILASIVHASSAQSATPDAMTIRMHRVAKKNSAAHPVAAVGARPKALANPKGTGRLPEKAEAGSISKMALTWLQNVELVAASAPETPLAQVTGLVIAGQYVLVPFDSISAISLHRGEPRFFVGQPRQEAQLVEFDMGGNQAILHVHLPYASSMGARNIRDTWPRTGETITAFQGTGASKFLSKINELNSDGILGRFTVPSPFSSKDSESFAFDNEANFIGLRSRYQDDYTPALYTRTLLTRAIQKTTDHSPASVGTIAYRLRDQWSSLQDHWTQSLLADRSQLQIENWFAGLGTKILKCQPLRMRLGDRDLSSFINRAEGQSCMNRASTKVDVGYQPGVETIAGIGDFRKPVDATKWASLTHEMAKSFFAPFDSDVQTVSIFASPQCRDSSARSTNGTELRISYCTSPLKSEIGLSDSVVFVASRAPADESFAFTGLRMKGFDQKNSKALVWALMENLRRAK